MYHTLRNWEDTEKNFDRYATQSCSIIRYNFLQNPKWWDCENKKH